MIRGILHFHGITITGNKDQLALRLYLLRHGETAAIMKNDTLLTYLVFALELAHLVKPPDKISIETLHELFEPMMVYLEGQRHLCEIGAMTK